MISSRASTAFSPTSKGSESRKLTGTLSRYFCSAVRIATRSSCMDLIAVRRLRLEPYSRLVCDVFDCTISPPFHKGLRGEKESAARTVLNVTAMGQGRWTKDEGRGTKDEGRKTKDGGRCGQCRGMENMENLSRGRFTTFTTPLGKPSRGIGFTTLTTSLLLL